MLDEEVLQNALDVLQTFDPPGVAAADLTESLMLQLMRLPASPARQMAAHLVQSSLQDLGKNRKQNVLRFRKLYPDTDSETIEAALDMIAELNPYPAYGFASATPTPYIQPDVWVKEGKDGWEVISNEAGLAEAAAESGVLQPDEISGRGRTGVEGKNQRSQAAH